MPRSTPNPIIISLAILKLNWDVEGHKSYLDNFVPIVAESIRLSGSKVVSVPELRNVLQKEFGLTIPLNAIESLLRRVRKHGYILRKNGIYIPIQAKLEALNFHKIQQSVLQMHDALVRHLMIYVKEYHNAYWTTEQAERALLQFLEENDLISLTSLSDKILSPQNNSMKISEKFLIGAFIQYLQNTHSHALEYLETVVKGNMLANALFLTVPGKEQKKFRQTQLYFDTPFIMFLLGYAGPERQAPCKELIALLRDSGAELGCFRHTVNEAKGILNAIGNRLMRGDVADAYGPSVEYFLTQGLLSSDIFMLVNRLEQDIQSFGIKVVEKPEYSQELYPYVIDEQRLKMELQEKVRYHNERAIDKDVESISAIMRLRRGRHAYELENSVAILVTMNSALFRVSRDFIAREINDPDAVPPAITDKTLTNLLWLKRPFDAPDLPRKRIIADCYAAIQPSDNLWAAYIREVEKLEQKGDITSEDYYMLRYSLESRRALMEVTLGEEEAFSQGTVEEVLRISREKIRQDLKEKLEEYQRVNRALEQKVRYERSRRDMEVSKQRSKIQHLSRKVAAVLARSVGIGLGLLLVGGSVFTFFSMPLPRWDVARGMVIVALLLLFLYGIVDLVWGSSLISMMRGFEVLLAKRIEELLQSMAGIQVDHSQEEHEKR